MSSNGTQPNRVASACLRAGLAVVFLVFGAEKLTSPEPWVVYLSPGFARGLDGVGLPLARFFHLLSLMELLVAVHLIAGWYVRATAAVAATELACVLASIGLDHSGIRDLGLLVGIALPLTLLPPDRWTLDALWAARRIRGSPAPLWRPIAWAAAMALGCLGAEVALPGGPATRPDAAAPDPLVVSARSPDPVRAEPIRPIAPLTSGLSAKSVLGRKLFHDVRLSGDGTVSCATCHDLDAGGVDGAKTAVGVGGQKGAINTPTVFNAVYNLSQFWDGRAPDLTAQALAPVENPLEMAGHWPEVVRKLQADQATRAEFAAVFGRRSISAETVTEAIADFERNLTTPGSKFDRWLQGDDTAMTSPELAGYEQFKRVGCIACHQGVNIGGNMYQAMGKFGDYFQDRGGPVTAGDLGRYNVTGREADRHKFKVPSLRNVALTAPYFHDGSAGTLEEAIGTMARYQLGRRLSATEVESIARFLRTLTGTRPHHDPP